MNIFLSKDEKITQLLKKFGAKNTLYNSGEFDKQFNSKGINIKFTTENKIDEIFKQFFQRNRILKSKTNDDVNAQILKESIQNVYNIPKSQMNFTNYELDTINRFCKFKYNQ